MKLEVKNASFYYDKENILFEDLSFDLESGEVLSVLGPNGAGKTTLIRCICGFLQWKTGTSSIDGKEISSLDLRVLWDKLSYVPQRRSATFGYTGLEMVVLGLSTVIGPFGKPTRKDYKKAAQLMDALSVGHLKDVSSSVMSGGELQMVLIARALINEPELIILDEPEAGLDFKNQLQIISLIKSLSKEKNIAAIVNTHSPAHALEISDKSLLMLDQPDHYIGKTKDIITAVNLKKAYGVDVHLEKLSLGDMSHYSVIPYIIDK